MKTFFTSATGLNLALEGGAPRDWMSWFVAFRFLDGIAAQIISDSKKFL
jgi:hypothetical protein